MARYSIRRLTHKIDSCFFFYVFLILAIINLDMKLVRSRQAGVINVFFFLLWLCLNEGKARSKRPSLLYFSGIIYVATLSQYTQGMTSFTKKVEVQEKLHLLGK